MNKVMTRTQRTSAGRPPGRGDTRRPAGTPPRVPTGGIRPAPAGGRPPGSPRTASTHTRPADNRPPTTGTPLTATPLTTPTVPAQSPRRPLTQPGRPSTTDLFADRLLAVLSGRRPVHSMLRHTVGRAYDDLAHLAERGPLRTTRGTLPIVRDIGYYVARPGALEVFARIGTGDRLRAMAFRLELGTDRRWRCTAVELGGPRSPHTDND
ncbi:Rv3235 family protein [Streptomyces phaeoluteigriseus]|uniref:Rv3235 family protein n=1 Tax=Streptomyces phaeoluteigriseus TaxID=114686 RepID=A0ABY4ZJH2_9ACTN|nr:Rv3235 family protein [Streptomyces phaeoluteigriseus]USQ88655.1 Rv3235 family protein [Streptomyces phaeoluteigriseus]